MKKLLALLLAMIVVLSLAACGDDSFDEWDDDDDDDDETVTQTEKDEDPDDVSDTQSPATQRPDPSVTDRPVKDTEAPKPDTEAPKPETEAPETEAPETEAPDTEAPDTEAPDTEAPVDTPTYAYTKGTVSNGKYTNLWADLGFTFDETWLDNTEAGGQSVAGTSTEMGLMLQNLQTGQVLQIMFEKLPVLQSNMTAEQYVVVLKAQLESSYAQIGYTVGEFSTSTRVIAGETYTALGIRFTTPQMVQVMYCRNLDGYMITLCVSAQNDANVNSVVSNITCA